MTKVNQLPPLVPREILFGNPERAMPQISPDGKRLAYLAPSGGVLNVWLKTVGQQDDTVITSDTKRGIRQYFWAEDNAHLMYLQDKDGDENWRIYSVDIATRNSVNITPFDSVAAELIGTNRKYPDEVLVGLNLRDRRFHDAYRINILTGEKKLVAENPGDVLNWTADNDFRVRALLAQSPDGGYTLRSRERE